MMEDCSGSEADNALALAEKLRHAVGRFVRGVRSQANTPTTSQSDTLSLLDRNGPLSVAKLAGLRNVRHQSMRLVVGQLERDGLVCKLPDPADGRSHLISVTTKGQQQLSRSRGARTAKIASLIEERLSAEERQLLQDAVALIERLSHWESR